MRLPGSTDHAARRRAYAEGWLQDRYVPPPEPFGYPEVTCAVARPFADRAKALRANWSREPGNVLLWSGPQVALGLFFHRSAAIKKSALARISDPELAGALTVLHPSPRPEGLPSSSISRGRGRISSARTDRTDTPSRSPRDHRPTAGPDRSPGPPSPGGRLGSS